MTDLTDPIFHNADAARAHMEAIRWADGRVCPHCGNVDQASLHALKGKSHRAGLYQCNACREHFTVTVGTVMERSKIPLNKWVLGFHLMAASKKGVSAHQLHRMLHVTYKTAWFMAHRIREAMRDDAPAAMGGAGQTVEADETYFGKRETPIKSKQRGDRPFTKRGKSGPAQKRAVLGLVERGGKVRTFHVDHAMAENVRAVIVRNISRESDLHTDESKLYTVLGTEFASHETVKHSAGEYVRYETDRLIHTNTIEGVFSIFKRGMKGIYQHCGEAHLHRYLAEFDFRYNSRSALGVSDAQRAAKALKAAEGKRLTYRRIGQAANA